MLEYLHIHLMALHHFFHTAVLVATEFKCIRINYLQVMYCIAEYVLDESENEFRTHIVIDTVN